MNYQAALFYFDELPATVPDWVLPINLSGNAYQIRGHALTHSIFYGCHPSDIADHIAAALAVAQRTWLASGGISHNLILPHEPIDWESKHISDWNVNAMFASVSSGSEEKIEAEVLAPSLLNHFDFFLNEPNAIQRGLIALVDSSLAHLRGYLVGHFGDKRLTACEVRDFASVVVCAPMRSGKSSLISAMHKAPGHYVGIPVDGDDSDGEPDSIHFEQFPPAYKLTTDDAEIIWVDLDAAPNAEECMIRAFELLANRFTAEKCPLLVFMQSTWSFARGNLDAAY